MNVQFMAINILHGTQSRKKNSELFSSCFVVVAVAAECRCNEAMQRVGKRK